MNELVRRVLRLTLADGVGSITFLNLCEHFGGVEAAAAAAGNTAKLRQVKGVGDKTSAAIAAVTDDDVEAEIALATKAGAAILCQDDPDYPAALRYIPDPPPLLYVMGSLVRADAVAMGVVGSRRCTHYGLEQAERFGGLLGRAGFTVVSGGAWCPQRRSAA